MTLNSTGGFIRNLSDIRNRRMAKKVKTRKPLPQLYKKIATGDKVFNIFNRLKLHEFREYTLGNVQKLRNAKGDPRESIQRPV